MMQSATDNTYDLGLDIGSTTVKVVVLTGAGEEKLGFYRRHHARLTETAYELLCEAAAILGDDAVV